MAKQFGFGLAVLLTCSFLSACGSSQSSNPERLVSETSREQASISGDVGSGPPAPPEAAFVALLSPEQAEKIRALGVPLVVPTAIPAGFTVNHVDTAQGQGFTDYRIVYRDGGDRCFVMEYASGGIGDIPTTEYRMPINAPLFDDGEAYGLNYGNYAEPSLREDFPEPELVSDWLPLETGAYRLAGAAYINNRLTPDSPCQDISPEEAVDIVESSAVMTDEIVGDG